MVEEEKHVAIKKIAHRDIVFLCIGVMVASALGWVEVSAGNAEARGEGAEVVVGAQKGVIDTGYIATKGVTPGVKLRPHGSVQSANFLLAGLLESGG